MKKLGSPTLFAAQLRAARALLNWSAQDLAEASGVSLRTIRRAEDEGSSVDLTTASATALLEALEGTGVQFLHDDNGIGVRLMKRGRRRAVNN